MLNGILLTLCPLPIYTIFKFQATSGKGKKAELFEAVDFFWNLAEFFSCFFFSQDRFFGRNIDWKVQQWNQSRFEEFQMRWGWKWKSVWSNVELAELDFCWISNIFSSVCFTLNKLFGLYIIKQRPLGPYVKVLGRTRSWTCILRPVWP